MFLNTLSTHGNITKDVKSFFDYVNSHVITSDFTQEIDEEVAEIKHNKKARDEYMLWEAMKTDLKREGHAEGLAEGKTEEKFAIARRMLTLGNSLQDIMLITDLPLTQIHKLQAELKA